MTYADCPKCNPLYPELDEDGRPYTCYFCCDTGRVPADVAAAYWQDREDEVEYVALRPVVNGKHQVLRGDDGSCWYETRPLLPASLFPRGAFVRQIEVADEDDDCVPPEPTELWDQQAREADAFWAMQRASDRHEARASVADPLDPHAFAFDDDIPF